MLQSYSLYSFKLPIMLGLAAVSIAYPSTTAASTSCAHSWTHAQAGRTECFDANRSKLKNASSDKRIKNTKTLAFVAPNALNQQIQNYAATRVGQQVGDGQCAALANEALKSFNAKTPDQLGPTDSDADYVWGTLVATLDSAQHSIANVIPGDIIQFRDVSTYKKETDSNGGWRFWQHRFPHHTAIVAGISGNRIELLHQNVGNDPRTRKTVQRGFVDIGDLQTGTMWVYRPVGE